VLSTSSCSLKTKLVPYLRLYNDAVVKCRYDLCGAKKINMYAAQLEVLLERMLHNTLSLPLAEL